MAWRLRKCLPNWLPATQLHRTAAESQVPPHHAHKLLRGPLAPPTHRQQNQRTVPSPVPAITPSPGGRSWPPAQHTSTEARPSLTWLQPPPSLPCLFPTLSAPTLWSLLSFPSTCFILCHTGPCFAGRIVVLCRFPNPTES